MVLWYTGIQASETTGRASDADLAHFSRTTGVVATV
jgi:hypothetical protein